REGSRSQGGESRDGVVVEVALRQGRIRLALPPEEALDIAAVLEQQRRGFVFRVTLEKDEQTVQLLHKHVDAGGIRPREHAIATRRQGVLWDVVPPGMRHRQ